MSSPEAVAREYFRRMQEGERVAGLSCSLTCFTAEYPADHPAG